MKEFKVKDIVKIMEEEIAPPSIAEDWDSPGLKTGSMNNIVTKVMTCLDVTVSVVEEAVEKGCDMIISHHPFIFGSINDVTQDSYPAVCMAVKAGITVFSAHTNLDYAPGGINDTLARAVGIENIIRDVDGKHTYGMLEKPTTVEEFAKSVKEKLNVPNVKIVLPQGRNMDDIISKVGVSCGAFDSKTYWFEPCGIEVLVTGELKHFDCIVLSKMPIITIGAGHYFTEYPGVKRLAERLGEYGIDCIASERDINLFKVF